VEYQGKHRSEESREEEDKTLPDDKWGLMEEVLTYLKEQEAVSAVRGTLIMFCCSLFLLLSFWLFVTSPIVLSQALKRLGGVSARKNRTAAKRGAGQGSDAAQVGVVDKLRDRTPLPLLLCGSNFPFSPHFLRRTPLTHGRLTAWHGLLMR
jgi:hypothetical protein